MICGGSEFSDYRSDLLRLAGLLRKIGITAYGLSQMCVFDTATQAEADNLYKGRFLPAEKSEALLCKGAIFIRIPQLGSQQSKQNRLQNGKDVFFSDSIVYAMRCSEKFGTYDFSLFRSKLISYFFVYNRKTAARGWALDNDNHITKHTTDAICHFLPFGDTPGSTTILYRTLISDELVPGTYIVISPFQEGQRMITSAELVDKWAVKT